MWCGKCHNGHETWIPFQLTKRSVQEMDKENNLKTVKKAYGLCTQCFHRVEMMLKRPFKIWKEGSKVIHGKKKGKRKEG